MIVASDFIQSTKARDSEFTTNQREWRLCRLEMASIRAYSCVIISKCLLLLRPSRWSPSDCAVCCRQRPDSGWCSLRRCTFFRWSWHQLRLSPKVSLTKLAINCKWGFIVIIIIIIKQFEPSRKLLDVFLFLCDTCCVLLLGGCVFQMGHVGGVRRMPHQQTWAREGHGRTCPKPGRQSKLHGLHKNKVETNVIVCVC